MSEQTTPATQLEIKHLAKKINGREIVSDVSLHLHQGEIIGLLGPNGAGKTTSFYMIVGLIPCDQGQVFLGQTEITNLPMHQRARMGIGYLPQEASVFRKLTVAENIMAILELRKDLDGQQRQEQLQHLLQEFHIEGLHNVLGMSLSGGERRRVEIARALARAPKFILLDEPFSGVDPISIMDIKKIIHQLTEKGIGVLITDHNVRETLTICSRAYIVNKGHIICSGNAQAILENQQVRDVYLGEEFSI